jgi:YhcN/YlaJ family sporulation lipoprotein
MKKDLIRSMLATILLIPLLAGCMNNNGQVQQQQVNQQPRTAEQRVVIAEKAADNIVKMKEVTQANVLVTQRNAYVAAVVNENSGRLTDGLEDRIAQQVRATDRNLENVYVSTNPEFVDRVNTYVADVDHGRPVEGFFEQLMEMTNRIFPNAR